MSASDHLQGEQLALFIPARVLANEVSSGETPDYEPIAKSDLYYIIFDENRKNGVPESIAREGINNPVTLYLEKGKKPFIADGHHRTVAMNELNPDYEVPVHYRKYMGNTETL